MLLEGARSYLLVSCCDAAGRNKCTVPKKQMSKMSSAFVKMSAESTSYGLFSQLHKEKKNEVT